MNFEAIIGLEIHVEMKTKTKMFSRGPVTYKAQPNTAVVPLDLGHPGTMPVVNKQAVINAIRVCDALHLSIDRTLWFDRKNYFYADLPKGYQITQNHRPIGSNGFIELDVEGQPFKVGIERLHLEEDTAMQHHYEGYTLVDYNRAGIPLMEIVTRPDIRTGKQAAAFVNAIREIVSFSHVSNGKMEEGSLRCDVNISIRPYGTTAFGTKVEIKNLNSIANVEKAIEFESIRQEQLLISGQRVDQETRRFDEGKKETVLMRKKTDAVDYKYFVEPNITPIQLSESFIEQTIQSGFELASMKRKRYQEIFLLSSYDASQLTEDVYLSEYFDTLCSLGKDYKLYANWLMGDIASYLNKHNRSIESFSIAPKRLVAFISLLSQGKISNKQGKELFDLMLTSQEDPLTLANQKNMLQISDPILIQAWIDEVLAVNPSSIEDFKQGKERAVGFLIGQILKKSGGKANPGLTNTLLMTTLKTK
jgi:aspartyl-tRNA(Asn)/glutamyl-tRNA(Gln) amidotransferase subunit B